MSNEQKAKPAKVDLVTNFHIPTPATDFAVSTLHSSFLHAIDILVEKFATDENKEEISTFIKDTLEPLHSAGIVTANNSVMLVEYLQEYLIKQRNIPLPAFYKIEDLMTGVKRHVTALPAEVLNKPGIGSDDPRWKTEPLSMDKLDAETRIPVRCETFDSVLYGYLELFRQETLNEETKDIQYEVSPFPAIRISKNYVPVSAVWRWYEVDEKTVKDAWKSGKSRVRK